MESRAVPGSIEHRYTRAASKDAIILTAQKKVHDMRSWTVAPRTPRLNGYGAPGHDAGRIDFREWSHAATALRGAGYLESFAHG